MGQSRHSRIDPENPAGTTKSSDLVFAGASPPASSVRKVRNSFEASKSNTKTTSCCAYCWNGFGCEIENHFSLSGPAGILFDHLQHSFLGFRPFRVGIGQKAPLRRCLSLLQRWLGRAMDGAGAPPLAGWRLWSRSESQAPLLTDPPRAMSFSPSQPHYLRDANPLAPLGHGVSVRRGRSQAAGSLAYSEGEA